MYVMHYILHTFTASFCTVLDSAAASRSCRWRSCWSSACGCAATSQSEALVCIFTSITDAKMYSGTKNSVC